MRSNLYSSPPTQRNIAKYLYTKDSYIAPSWTYEYVLDKYSIPREFSPSFNDKNIKGEIVNEELSNWGMMIPNSTFMNFDRIDESLHWCRILEGIKQKVDQINSTIKKVCFSSFNLQTWIYENFSPYQMLSGVACLGIWHPKDEFKEFKNSVYVHTFRQKRNITFYVTGTLTAVRKFEKWLESSQNFYNSKSNIIWMFGQEGSSVINRSIFPVEEISYLPEAYPWFKVSPLEYIHSYFDSKESILILKGPPGTGKTSFIKLLLQETNNSAITAYDRDLLLRDEFYIEFLTDPDTDILVIEDNDILLSSRANNNPVMDKFLNTSDGLVSLRHKKIIFSTNIPNISSIDSALTRKGRCFDILNFQKINGKEAKILAKAYYNPLTFDINSTFKEGLEYSIAEVLNIGTTSDLRDHDIPNQIGFIK